MSSVSVWKRGIQTGISSPSIWFLTISFLSPSGNPGEITEFKANTSEEFWSWAGLGAEILPMTFLRWGAGGNLGQETLQCLSKRTIQHLLVCYRKGTE